MNWDLLVHYGQEGCVGSRDLCTSSCTHHQIMPLMHIGCNWLLVQDIFHACIPCLGTIWTHLLLLLKGRLLLRR